MNIDEYKKIVDELTDFERYKDCNEVSVIIGSDTDKIHKVNEFEYKSHLISMFEAPNEICPKEPMLIYKSSKEADENQAIVFGDLVPFKSGITERKSFYEEAGLASYGDWSVLNRRYLGKITIKNLKDINTTHQLKTKFYQRSYKYVFPFYKKETVRLFDDLTNKDPFAYFTTDNLNTDEGYFTVEKYKCKVNIKKDKTGVEILYIRFPLFKKMPKDIYLKYEKEELD